MSEVPTKHKEHAPTSLGVYIVTCSNSRYLELMEKGSAADDTGDLIERLCVENAHRIHGRVLVPDVGAQIRSAIKDGLENSDVDAVILNGGSGLSPTDVTIEVARTLFETEIPGFGELFRKISYDDIGSAALMSRATAGVVAGKIIFCLPGAPAAAATALTKLILPELGHLIKIVRGI